jgi:hypothetical protein
VVPVRSEAVRFNRRDRTVMGAIASLTLLFVLFRVMV